MESTLDELLKDESARLAFVEEGLEFFCDNESLATVQDSQFQSLLQQYREAADRLAKYIEEHL